MRSFFRFKDKIPTIYKFTCADCNDSYIGETRKHYLVRKSQHLGISAFTGKKSSYIHNKSSVTKHVIDKQCKNNTVCENFEIITRCRGDPFRQKVRESLLIAKDNPPINGQQRSVKLELF